MNGDEEYEDWRSRYDAAIVAYEAMAEHRRERKSKRRAQALRDERLRVDDEIDREWLESHPEIVIPSLHRRMETSRMAWRLLMSLCGSPASAVTASVAAGLMRKFSTATVNRVEAFLWRTNRNVGVPRDSRTTAEKERRKITRRSTESPMPTPDDVRRLWLDAGNSCRGIIAFGALVHDLECYVDNSLTFDDDGNIVGRAEGILGWLKENVPELAVRYKTIMRYKSIAKRCRQYLQLKDPRPLDPDDPRLALLLQECPATQKDVRERLDAAIER